MSIVGDLCCASEGPANASKMAETNRMTSLDRVASWRGEVRLMRMLKSLGFDRAVSTVRAPVSPITFAREPGNCLLCIVRTYQLGKIGFRVLALLVRDFGFGVLVVKKRPSTSTNRQFRSEPNFRIGPELMSTTSCPRSAPLSKANVEAIGEPRHGGSRHHEKPVLTDKLFAQTLSVGQLIRIS